MEDSLYGASVPGPDKVLTPGKTAILRKVGKLSADFQAQIQKGDARFEHLSQYVRSLVTAGGTIPILNETNQRVVGVTTFNAGKLLSNTNQLVEELRVAYATHATETDVVKMKYSSQTAAVPAALVNGELVIQVGSRVTRIPLSQCFIVTDTYGSNEIVWVKLSEPIFITDKDSVTISIDTKPGSSFGTGNHFVSVEFRGNGIVRA